MPAAYRAIEPHPRDKIEPAALTDDMRVADLVEVLATLRFHGESRCLLSVDRGVRDYLLRAIKTR